MSDSYYQKYSSNIVYSEGIETGEIGPYLILAREKRLNDVGPNYYAIGNIYQFKTKKEFEEALKDINGIPVKTLEAKVIKDIKVEWGRKK